MRPMTRAEREILESRRICDVCEPWLEDALKNIPHSGRRVLVPDVSADRFSTITKHGGGMLPTAYRITIARLARLKVGTRYEPKAIPERAPKVYSCSTFVAWLFAFVGLSMPRYAIDQSYVGRRVRQPGQLGLAFYRNAFPIEDEDRAIGHVGLTTREGTIIHGSREHVTIVEEPIPDGAVLFTDPFPDGVQRLIIIPNKIQGVETALDLARWLARPLT